MAFSSKQENDYESQLEQIAGEVDGYIVKTDGSLEYFREQIRPLAQKWKTYHEAVDKRKKELLDHWEKVKKNPTLQDKNIKQSENWEWDKFYLHGLGSFGSNPINEMPAKYALDVMAALEKYLERKEKNERGYPENSSEYKRLQEAIAKQRQDLEDIRSEFDKLSSAKKKSVWIKTPPKTVIPNKAYVKFTWWRYLNLPEEAVFGCWRPPLIPLPEDPFDILKPVESEYYINQTRKELPDARNPQEEYERYYIFLSSVHDNYLQGVEKITEGIWFNNLQTAVLCCLDKGHGDKTAFLKAALGRVCQSNHKTDKKKEQEKPEGNMLMMSSRSSKENWEAIRSEYGISKKDFGKKINFVSDSFKRKIIFRDIEHAFVLASQGFPKPAIILAGGVIEELLRLYLENKNINPKCDKFFAYIEACENKKLLKRGVSRLSDSIRDFRNLVHLDNEKTKRYTISKAAAKGAVASIFTITNDFQKVSSS